MHQNLDRFLRYIQHEKRYAVHTVTAYGHDITQFLAFINENFGGLGAADINHSFIRSWVVSLMEGEMSTRAVNRKISSLRSFFRFLLREKVIERNPMLRVTAPKNGKKLPVYVEKSGMELLFSHIAVETDFNGMRDRMVLELFYATGMRLSELINLELKDISLYSSTVKVLGKRNKERIIPFSPTLRDAISIYLEKRKELLAQTEQPTGCFIINDRGEQMTSKTIYTIVKKYLTLVTTISKKSPHVLRHTFATHLLNNGADINAIKEILGHSSLAATQVYTHNSIEKLKAAHRQAHPKG